MKLSVAFILLLCLCLLMNGCAGPLDSVTKQALETTFVRNTYLAKVYLGNRYHLDYTNNSVSGRSPTGVFVDQLRGVWYETDASFWESGTSGDEYTLERLKDIDRDLDFHTFGQGIQPGQIVMITELDDKKDQVIFEVETLVRYPVTKSYGVDTNSRAKPRAGRIHCILGEATMQDFDQTLVSSLLARVLAPVSVLTTEAQKEEFIITHTPETPVEDLAQITEFSKEDVLRIHYTHLLTQAQIAPELRESLTETLADLDDTLANTLGLHIQAVRVDADTLSLDCAVQDITQSVLYYSQELRASLIFFEDLTFPAKALGLTFASVPNDSTFQAVRFNVSTLYFDPVGRRIPEQMSAAIPIEPLREYAAGRITEQTLADRSQIDMHGAGIQVNLNALEAVQQIKQSGPLTWKKVEVDFVDWDYVEHEDEEVVVIEGEVQNTGTWIARDIEVIARGYDKYSFHIRTETTSLYDLLKPGETKNFTIKMNSENLKRFKLFLEWREVE